VDFGSDDGETLITEALDLVRSLIHDNPAQAEQLMQALEAGEPVVAHTMTEAQPPDLVQLTTMILEESLAKTNSSRNRTPARTQLITSAMSVLAALLALPNYSNRVWLYIRSTTALFSSDKSVGFASVALATERTTGHYTMTLSLLYLVQQLFREASISVLPDNQRLQQLKEEVLLRAARFVHTEIWVEHLSWKYAQLGDRFEIGKRVSLFYSEVLEHAPPTLRDGPFTALSQTIADALLFRASTSSINPLVSAITSGNHVLRMLYASRRLSDARRLVFLLESHLHLSALLLNYKQQSVLASTPCLLEQTLSSRIIGGASSFDSIRAKSDPIDVIASYVKSRDLGNIVPLEAMHLLYALLSSLSTVSSGAGTNGGSSSPQTITIIGHLSDPEMTVNALVRIVEHPYDDLALRNAIWRFIALAVDKEPALASLFVSGRFRTPSASGGAGGSLEGNDKGKGKGRAKEEEAKTDKETGRTAMDVAKEALESWKEMWESNPQLLAALLRFICVVWEHGLEHKSIVNNLRQSDELWDQLNELVQEDLGPAPPHETEIFVIVDSAKHSNAHEAVQSYAYRTQAKAYAVRILGLDIDIASQLNSGKDKKPLSLIKLESCFKEEIRLSDLLSDASANAYCPELYDQLAQLLKDSFPGLVLEHLEIQKPKDVREFGDGYTFNVPLYRTRLRPYPRSSLNAVDAAERQLSSINMNLSLTDAQKALTESWEFLLHKLTPHIRGDSAARTNLLAVAASMSYAIGEETRSGEVMALVHQARLSLLLAVLELAWFALKEKPEEVQSFVEMSKNVRGIILNEAQSPASAIVQNSPVPFHRTLLQIVYYCVKQGRSLIRREKAFHADQRVVLATFVEATLSFVIEALRIVFIMARTRVDVDVDRDMELLVSVFEQCIRHDINLSSTFWLVKCQETDIIRTSLDLYAHIDLVGLTDLPLLHAKKQPLYAPHILLFHMALASNVTAAERLASEGILTTYSNNFISPAISNAQIDVVLPKLPGERSPAHVAYCSMISIVAVIITALGRHNHYFDAEVCGFVQLYGEQFARAFTWTIGDPITFPLLEEAEQVVNLFYAVAANSPSASASDPAFQKVLRFFTTHALNFLQQLNYAITHPNHLASLLEPVTADERTQLEKEKALQDPLKRPLVMQLLHRLYRLSSNVVGALIVISKADSVLLTPEGEWPTQEALIVPVGLSVFFDVDGC
jgi:nuclear pore complex protein Nup188